MFMEFAQITQKERWSDWILLSLKTFKIAEQARPGQFVMIKVNDSFHPLLRRPFSIHNVTSGEIEIFFQIVGSGTTILSEKKIGEKLNIIGPLGKGFQITPSIQNKEYYLIGGGRGIAPLFFLAKEIKKKGGIPRVLYGAKTEKDLPLLKKFSDEGIPVYPSTEDGSLGWHGLIAELFEYKLKEGNKIEKIFVCGPHEMMKKIALIAEKNELDAEYSLESIFGCGIGACWGCVVKLRREREKWVKACSEGPVFSGKEIIW